MLVLVVIAVAGSFTFIAYRAAWRSLEEHAVSSLETATDARVHSIESELAHKRERLASTTKAIDLACDTGSLNVVCTTELLRPFIRKEHARGARLHTRKNKQVTVGQFIPDAPSSSTPVVFQSGEGPLLLSMSYRDPESGSAIEIQWSASQLREVAADPEHPVDLLARFDNNPRNILTSDTVPHASMALSRCLDGLNNWELQGEGRNSTYRVFRYVPTLHACLTTGMAQSTALAPIDRLRLKLSKTVAGFILGAAFLAYLLGYLLTHPLKMLRKRIRGLKQGDFDSPVPVAGTGEIYDLSQAIASMAQSLLTSRSALAQSEKKLMLAYKAAGLWIWSYDSQTRIFTWQDPSDVRPPKSGSLRGAIRQVDVRDRHAVMQAVRLARQTGLLEIEFRPNAPGTERWISAWGQVLHEESGRPSLMAGISLDSTSRREAARLSGEREKLIATADMAASLAHEINNPLSSVVGAVYMASSSTAAQSPELRKYLDIARQETDRVAHIAREMLSLYRKPSSPEPVDLHHLLLDITETCRIKAERKKQRLKTDLHSCGNVLGFADELRQALMNVIVNAIEHSPEQGAIQVRAHRCQSSRNAAERGVKVVVANSGTCSLPDETSSVFEPFVGTKSERGHGLGLWVTRSIVLKHGGYIRLRPYGKEHSGVCCVVYLPLRGPSMSG